MKELTQKRIFITGTACALLGAILLLIPAFQNILLSLGEKIKGEPLVDSGSWIIQIIHSTSFCLIVYVIYSYIFFHKNELTEKICILLTFVILAFFYVFHCTESSLWYDEGIEYWVSKSISGIAYGNNIRNLPNMYERICCTIQPPFYNIIMFLWLKICDTEFWFKFFSSICFFIGSIAFYLTCREFSNKIASCSFTLIFGLGQSFIFYAHEAAEYTCLFCFACWMILFFVRSTKSYSWKNLTLYFCFASLSLYSQYGACFIILGTGISLFIRALIPQNKEKIYKNLIRFLILGCVALTVFVIPLFIFFMKRQLLSTIGRNSHHPTFEYGIILIDYLMSFMLSNNFFFGKQKTIILCIIAFIVFIHKISKKKFKSNLLYATILISVLISWTTYYIAVRFNIYKTSYTSGFGNRWGMAFCSISGLLFSYSLTEFHSVLIKNCKLQKVLCSTTFLIFMFFTFIPLFGHAIKSHVREAYSFLKENKSDTQLILVERWYQPTVAFYITHDITSFSENDVVYLKNHTEYESKQNLSKEFTQILKEKDITTFWYFGGSEPANKNNMIQAFFELDYENVDEIKFDNFGDPTLIYFIKKKNLN